MDKEEIKNKIVQEEDYIRCPKCSNSLLKFMARNSDGVENKVIARLLLIPEEKVEELYKQAVDMLKAEMKENE